MQKGHVAGLVRALGSNRSSLALAGSTYASLALGIITGPIIAQTLGASARGEYAAGLVYANFVVLFAGLGLPIAISVKLFNSEMQEDEALGLAIKWSICTIFFALIVASLVEIGPVRGYSPTGRLGVAAVILLTPVSVAGLCASSMILVRGRLLQQAYLRALPLVLSAIFTVTLATLDQLNLGSVFLILISTSVISGFETMRLLHVRPKFTPIPRRVLVLGCKSLAGGLANLANARLDQLLLVGLVSSASLGEYAVAVSISQLPISLSAVISSRMIARAKGLETLEQDKVVGSAIKLVLMLTSFVSVVLGTVTWLVLPTLYGRQFQLSRELVIILLPGAVFLGTALVTATALTMQGQVGRASWSEIAGVCLTVVGLITLLSKFGIVGAACVSTLSYFLTASLNIYFVRSGRRKVRGAP